MSRRSVTTPSGDVWTVRRCWMARRSVRWRGRIPPTSHPAEPGRSRIRGRHVADPGPARSTTACLISIGRFKVRSGK